VWVVRCGLPVVVVDLVVMNMSDTCISLIILFELCIFCVCIGVVNVSDLSTFLCPACL